jgi:hypothetical protein
MGFGAAKLPREVFLDGVGGFAANTIQKLSFGRSPNDVAFGGAWGGFAAPQGFSGSFWRLRRQNHPKTGVWGAAPTTL